MIQPTYLTIQGFNNLFDQSIVLSNDSFTI